MQGGKLIAKRAEAGQPRQKVERITLVDVVKDQIVVGRLLPKSSVLLVKPVQTVRSFRTRSDEKKVRRLCRNHLPFGAQIVGEHVKDTEQQVHFGQADWPSVELGCLKALVQFLQQFADLSLDALIERLVQRRAVPRNDEHLSDVTTRLLQFRPVAKSQCCVCSRVMSPVK